MARNPYLIGPGKVSFGGVEFNSEGNINGSESFTTFPINTSLYGKIDERTTDREIRVNLTPAGELESLTAYLPHLTASIGDVLFSTTSDTTLIVYGKDGTRRTYSAAALTKMPSLHLGSDKPMWGQMEWTCLGAGNGSWSDASDIVALADLRKVSAVAIANGGSGYSVSDVITASGGTAETNATFTVATVDAGVITGVTISNAGIYSTTAVTLTQGSVAPSGGTGATFTPTWISYFPTSSMTLAKIQTAPFTAAWGAEGSPWNALKTVGGFDIDLNMSIAPLPPTDWDGTVQYQITGFEVQVRFSPVGVVASDITGKMKAQGTGAGRGKSMSALGAGNFVMTGGTSPYAITATVKSAAIKSYNWNYDRNNTPRVTDVTMISCPGTIGGTLEDYFTLAMA